MSIVDRCIAAAIGLFVLCAFAPAQFSTPATPAPGFGPMGGAVTEATVKRNCPTTAVDQITVKGTATGFGQNYTVTITAQNAAGTNVGPTQTINIANGAGTWGATWTLPSASNATKYKVTICDAAGILPGSCLPDLGGDLIQGPCNADTCGQKDDGTTENSLGLTAGGEIGWLTAFSDPCITTFDSIETAYGTALFPGSVTNGAASKVVIYEDIDGGDPTSGMVVQVKVNTVIVNGDTDILNKVALGIAINRTNSSTLTYPLVSADHAAGQFPAPMDQTPPTLVADAWVVGSTLGPGTLNTTNLNANDVPLLNMAAIGFPANWLLRLDNTGGPSTGSPVCFGDGTGTACPCGNDGGPGAGCANGTGGGGVLSASGTASVSSDTMSLTANGVVNNNGLFFQGNNTIGGGAGSVFGDGIRCCGGGVVRIQVVNPPGTTSPATAIMTETATTNGPGGTVVAGGKKCYQFWYRDPASSPCGTQFNLTNAVTITWQP